MIRIKLLQSIENITNQRSPEDLHSGLLVALCEVLAVSKIELSEIRKNKIENVISNNICVSIKGSSDGGYVWTKSSTQQKINASQEACLIESNQRVFQTDEFEFVMMIPLKNECTHTQSLLTICSHRDLSADIEVISYIIKIYCNHLFILSECERDQLTGLLNRRTFDIKFADLVEKQRQLKLTAYKNSPNETRKFEETATSWLAILDIDHFKKVNDTFGHVYGDEILLLVAKLMNENFRTDDALFRFGGEEFVILLSPTTHEYAFAVLERFRSVVASYLFPQVGNVTLSAGFAHINHHETSTSILGSADQALYYAKENGRNRVCSYETMIAAIKPSLSAQHDSPGSIELF